MLNHKPFKIGLAATFMISIMVLFSGCGERLSVAEVYNFYNLTQLYQTQSEVEATLGVEPVVEDKDYTYLDEKTQFGVTVNYDDSGKVVSKMLYSENDDNYLKLNRSDVSEDQKSSITQGMTYEEVKTILGGEGIEMGSYDNPLDKSKPLYLMGWLNSDKTGIYVSFVGKNGTVFTVDFY